MEETKDKGIIEGKRQMIEREAAVLADTIDKRLLLQRARAAAAAAAGQPAPALSPEADETRKRLLRAEAQRAPQGARVEGDRPTGSGERDLERRAGGVGSR